MSLHKETERIWRNSRCLILAAALSCVSCATTQTRVVAVKSDPPGTLISVFHIEPTDNPRSRIVAGETPFEKQLEFGAKERIWLQAEKRGYELETREVTPASREVMFQLQRLSDQDGIELPEYSFPETRNVLLAEPRVRVFHRGFSTEERSIKDEQRVANSIKQGVTDLLGRHFAVSPVAHRTSAEKDMKRIWRDVRTAMEIVDPIRLKYLSRAPQLESKAAIRAVRQRCHEHDAQVILIIAGKQNVETDGMVAGKIGLTAVGTAASFAGGYSRAVARGDSFFAYHIYTPTFATGTALKALAVSCTNGEIVWSNSGFWSLDSFENAESVSKMIEDLLTGLY